MIGDVRDPDWLGFANQEPEHATPARQSADQPPLLGGNPSRHELHQLTGFSDDTQRSVACVCDLGGQVDDPLQHDRQRQLRGESEPRFEEYVLAIAATGHRRRMYPSRVRQRAWTT